jgi:hypothetical protein
MRTILFLALGSLAAFATGLAGTYFVLPVVAPEVAEAQRVRADSLARIDSLALAADSTAADGLAASLAAGLAADSLADDSAPAVPVADSLADLGAPMAVDGSLPAAALQDSLVALQRRVEAYEAQIRDYEAQLGERAAQRAQASDLAGTLVKLEDRELSGTLEKLDLDVLELLYEESSARNRARLLGALPPARTGAFVRRATSGNSGPEPTAEPEPTESAEPVDQNAGVSAPR